MDRGVAVPRRTTTMDLHLATTAKFAVIEAGAAPAGASLAPPAPAASFGLPSPPLAPAAPAAAAADAGNAAAEADALADEISALEAQITKKGAEIKTLKVRARSRRGGIIDS